MVRQDPLSITLDSRRLQRVGIACSLIFHTMAFAWAYLYVGRAAEQMVTRVLFVSPPPITKKSFELAKRPEISEVQLQMLMSAPQEQMPTVDVAEGADVSVLGADILSAVAPVAGAGGGGGVGRITGMISGSISGARPPQMSLQAVGAIQLAQVAKPAQQSVSMRTELLNVKNLDTGRYKATLIIDPADKRNVKGYFNMTLVKYNYQDPNRDAFQLAVPNLIQYVNEYTNLRASVVGQKIELSERDELLNAPFIYMTGYTNKVFLTGTEMQNLAEYLRQGGFLFVEDISPLPPNSLGTDPAGGGVRGTTFDQQMRALLKESLGAEAQFYRIPKDHPLFHSFYDFGDGPPRGGAAGGNVYDLEGIDIRGRLAVVFSDLNISWYWGAKEASGRERGLQFGVNLIVYALTQPGGLANIAQYGK